MKSVTEENDYIYGYVCVFAVYTAQRTCQAL